MRSSFQTNQATSGPRPTTTGPGCSGARGDAADGHGCGDPRPHGVSVPDITVNTRAQAPVHAAALALLKFKRMGTRFSDEAMIGVRDEASGVTPLYVADIVSWLRRTEDGRLFGAVHDLAELM
jgi:hypothetical protein